MAMAKNKNVSPLGVSKENARDFDKVCGRAEMAINFVCPDHVGHDYIGP